MSYKNKIKQKEYNKNYYNKTKESRKEYHKQYNIIHKIEKSKYYKNWAILNKDKLIQKRKDWYKKNIKNNQLKIRKNNLKYNYNLTPEEYNNLIIYQNNMCSICGKTFKIDDKICIDHNHKTKKLRGLLCDNCNKGLGHFKDSTSILENAILYLNKSKFQDIKPRSE